MNIQQIWAYGRSQLTRSPAPELDARLLLEHVLKVSHTFLITHGEKEVEAADEQQYKSLINRARQQEPIPYITGHAPFFGLDFTVTPAVLIPRPETEQLVETILTWAKPRQPLRVVDVGTGSGCIATCLAQQLPESSIEAVDISSSALAIAKQNAQRHVPERIQFHLGSLLTPVVHQPDLIVANLPYITNAEWTMLDDGVKLYEPMVALKGGIDGLDLVRQLLQQATSKLNPGGAIFLEIGWQQGQETYQLGLTYFPAAQVELLSDYAGHDRIVAIKTG